MAGVLAAAIMVALAAVLLVGGLVGDPAGVAPSTPPSSATGPSATVTRSPPVAVPSPGESPATRPGDAGSPPPATRTREEPPSPDPQLADFLDDCRRGLREWRAGQVSYPSALTLRVGATTSYVAAVDIRTTPEAPGTLLPGPSPTGEAVFVRCEVAARLTPLGDALEVDEEGWVLRSFTPTGVIRWSWAVTAVDGGTPDLRLEMQPAVVSEDGTVLVGEGSTEVSSFFTRTRIDEGAVRRVGDWWSDNWGTVTLVAGGLGAAVLGLLKYGEQLALRMRRVVAAWRGEPLPPEGDEPATEHPRTDGPPGGATPSEDVGP